MTYRKLTNDEVLNLAQRIKHADDIDLDYIRASVKELFGESAHKAVLYWGSEYDDENYSHRPNDIKVWNAAGKRLHRPAVQCEDTDDCDEALYEFFRDLDFGCFQDADDDLGEMTILINETKGLDLPDLYVQES